MSTQPRTTKLYGRILVIHDTKEFLANHDAEVKSEHPEDHAEIMISINGNELKMTLEDFIERVFQKN